MRMTITKCVTLTATLGIALVASAIASAADRQPVTIGFNGEPGNHIVVTTAKRVLEERLGYDVKIVQASNGLQWQGVAQGDMDAMLVAWLPTTQAAYWKKYKDDVLDLGAMFTGKIGWVIPDSIPKSELSAIPDLKDPEVREKMNGEIVGIQPGAGIMDRSEKALDAYGLDDYTLRSSSTAAMGAALERATANDDWVVVTGWSPLHIFARWDLRYLEDPKGVFGVTQKIHAIARQGIREDRPRAATFLSQYELPNAVLEQALLHYDENDDIDAAVTNLIEGNPDLVDEWVAGAGDKRRYVN